MFWFTAKRHPSKDQQPSMARAAEQCGRYAVERALRPLFEQRRRVLTEVEAEAWSDCARRFDDEFAQKDWP